MGTVVSLREGVRLFLPCLPQQPRTPSTNPLWRDSRFCCETSLSNHVQNRSQAIRFSGQTGLQVGIFVCLTLSGILGAQEVEMKTRFLQMCFEQSCKRWLSRPLPSPPRPAPLGLVMGLLQPSHPPGSLGFTGGGTRRACAVSLAGREQGLLYADVTFSVGKDKRLTGVFICCFRLS